MGIDKDYGKVIKAKIINKMRVKNIKDLCSLPLKNEVVHIVTQKNITRHTFTEWVLSENGVIDEIIISTYRFSIKNAKILKKYIIDKNVKEAFILIAQNYKMLLGQGADELESIFKSCGIKYKTAYNHSKVTLMNAGANYYVLTGSGNYSENDHIEEYQMCNNKDLYEFHKGWMKNGK